MTRQGNIRAISIVLYVTLALLWVAIPQSITNWSREFLPDFAQPFATRTAEAVEAAANTTRIPVVYTTARSAFQSATKK